MKASLNPSGEDVRLGEVRLRTPGLNGHVETLLPQQIDGRLRAPPEEGASRELETALEKSGVTRQWTLVISATHENRKDAEGLRLDTSVEPVIEIEVPVPEEGWGQFVLTHDEAGVATWSFAVAESEEIPVYRGIATRVYRIPRHIATPPEPEVTKTRGLVRAVGKKLIKILIFPLAEDMIGSLGERYAANWEAQNRPYGLRTVSPDDYREPSRRTLDPQVVWSDLGKGRALLFVHGTFSRAYTAFSGLPKETMKELWQLYSGRVFAFDHPTISEDPKQNVEYFLRQMPESAKLELDIVCHSRGGLVSRVLAEKQSELLLGSRQVLVRRIVFVGVPNAGTILTDSQYLGELLNAYTNLLNFFPDNGVTEMLEGVIAVAKMLATGALKGLPGLQAMLPQGKFLRGLNDGPRPSCSYYALASNFEPKEPGFREWAKNHLMDRIFQGVANDLVVPTYGVYAVEGSEKFPIAERYVFPTKKGISHTGFFAARETQKYILKWLS